MAHRRQVLSPIAGKRRPRRIPTTVGRSPLVPTSAPRRIPTQGPISGARPRSAGPAGPWRSRGAGRATRSGCDWPRPGCCRTRWQARTAERAIVAGASLDRPGPLPRTSERRSFVCLFFEVAQSSNCAPEMRIDNSVIRSASSVSQVSGCWAVELPIRRSSLTGSQALTCPTSSKLCPRPSGFAGLPIKSAAIEAQHSTI